MDDLLSSLTDAASRGDWLQVAVMAVVAVAVLVAAGLKVAGKQVPVLDKLIDLAKGLLKLLPKKQVEAKPGDPQGVEAVVKVEAESDKK